MGGPTKPKRKPSIRSNPMYQTGYEEGARDTTNKALTFLEEKYLHPSVARGSEEGKAILKLAEELSSHLNGKG